MNAARLIHGLRDGQIQHDRRAQRSTKWSIKIRSGERRAHVWPQPEKSTHALQQRDLLAG